MKRYQFWNFFSHKANKVKKTSLRRLLPEEFDADLLRQLTLEGRVYIDVPQKIDKDAWKHEVLEYVSVIDDYATEMWKGQLDDVWNAIVDAECLSDYLVMKKGELSGHMNRYTVTNLVCRMRYLGVYSKDVSMQKLHLRMEHTTKKNKYYKNFRNYKLSREASIFLRSFFS